MREEKKYEVLPGVEIPDIKKTPPKIARKTNIVPKSFCKVIRIRTVA